MVFRAEVESFAEFMSDLRYRQSGTVFPPEFGSLEEFMSDLDSFEEFMFDLLRRFQGGTVYRPDIDWIQDTMFDLVSFEEFMFDLRRSHYETLIRPELTRIVYSRPPLTDYKALEGSKILWPICQQSTLPPFRKLTSPALYAWRNNIIPPPAQLKPSRAKTRTWSTPSDSDAITCLDNHALRPGLRAETRRVHSVARKSLLSKI